LSFAGRQQSQSRCIPKPQQLSRRDQQGATTRHGLGEYTPTLALLFLQ